MKKIALTALIGLTLSIPTFAANHLTTSVQDKAFNKIATLDNLNGYDVADIRKFVAIASPQEIKNYIVELSYEKAKLVDNPNAMDLADLQGSFERKSLDELIK